MTMPTNPTNADELDEKLSEILEGMDGFMASCCDDDYRPAIKAKAKLTHLIRQEVLKELDALEKQKRTADSFVGDVYVIRATRVHQRQEKLSQELNGEEADVT